MMPKTRYLVTTRGVTEEFTHKDVEKLKRLGMVTFRGSRRVYNRQFNEIRKEYTARIR